MSDPLTELFDLVTDDTGLDKLTAEAMHGRLVALAEHDLDAAAQIIRLVLVAALRSIRDGAHTGSPAALAEAALIVVTGDEQHGQDAESGGAA